MDEGLVLPAQLPLGAAFMNFKAKGPRNIRLLKRLENHQKTRKTQQKWKNGENTKVQTPRWKHQRVGKESVQENKWKQHGFRKVKTPIHQFQKTHQTPRGPWPLRWRLARGLPPRNGPSTRRGGPRFFSGAGAFYRENRFPQLEGWPIFGWAVFFGTYLWRAKR